MSMKLLFLIVCLIYAHGSSCTTVEGKRYEYQSMVDPLTRRSPLDKNFMRFGRSSSPSDEDKPQEDMERMSRAKDNFIRFGRSDENDKDLDSFLRTERARRFVRGRDVQNFIRFGRGRDNFMRFGPFDKTHEDGLPEQDLALKRTILSGVSKRTSNFMRFGRGDVDPIDRSNRAKMNNNFLRFGRGKQDSGFVGLERFSRPFQDKHNDGFIRFGRSEKLKDQRTKRSLSQDDLSLYQLFEDYDSEPNDGNFSDDLDEGYEGPSPRTKRSVILPLPRDNLDQDGTHLKPLHYYPFPLSAGLPNFIVGPEFSLLPPLDISSSKLKRGKIGDRNFIRLG